MKIEQGQSFFFSPNKQQICRCIAISQKDEFGIIKVIRTEYKSSFRSALYGSLKEFDALVYEPKSISTWKEDSLKKEVIKIIEEDRQIQTLADIPKEWW